MTLYPKINAPWHRNIPRGGIFTSEFCDPAVEALAEEQWDWSEKVNGTNIRVIWQDGELTFGGKGENSVIPASLMDKLRELIPETAMSVAFPLHNVVLYGEGIGHNIQGGDLRQEGYDFILFDVKTNGLWSSRAGVRTIAQSLVIPVAPTIGKGTLWQAVAQVEDGFESLVADTTGVPAEGLVLRHAAEVTMPGSVRIITKIKAKDDFSETRK